MTELVEVKKGEGSLDLKIEGGKVLFAIKYDGKQADAKFEISLGIEEYLELLKKAIPGELDDKVIDMIQIAMKV